jgi:glycosyltransferase involved in cell wall biosynthesis
MGGRGLEQLVDAAATFDGADLVLLGSGPLEAALVRRARDAGSAERVHLLAPVPSDEVVDYAASADVGVSPIVPSCLNYRYSLPNKLFQYMAAGVPVVASDFPQVREVVEGSGSGVVVDTTRPELIASAVNRILADPEEARAMGERGRAAVDERYNWSTAAETLLSVYAGLRA